MESNPYLEAALESSAPNNVTGTLTFLLTRVISGKDPAKIYDPDLIRAAAAAPPTEANEAQRRLKTVFKSDMNTRHWNEAIKAAKAELVTALPAELQIGSNGSIKPNLANAIMVLRREAKLSFDNFSNRVVIMERTPWGPARHWCDDDDIALVNFLQHKAVNLSGIQTANHAAWHVAKENQFHPVRDWLNSLEWDGNHRLDSWMYRHLGVQADIAYLRRISSMWCISAVARIMRPGCQAKAMIVLEGPQDAGKSKALRALTNGHLSGETGIQWFRDSLPKIDNPEIGSFMQGAWVIEIGELAAIRGKHWEDVKVFIALQTDVFRKKFGHNIQDYPRQSIFSGSTNEERWGGDPSGLSRFWPALVTEIDIDGILEERDQIWAEAKYRYDAGEEWWLDEEGKRLAKIEQDLRQPEDIWHERIAGKLKLHSDISIPELMDLLAVPAEKQDSIQYRFSRALATMGWKRYRQEVGQPWRYSRDGD